MWEDPKNKMLMSTTTTDCKWGDFWFDVLQTLCVSQKVN